ncbi:MAG: hypothetical protein R2729_09000 [Bryobacteraceae bacterium]
MGKIREGDLWARLEPKAVGTRVKVGASKASASVTATAIRRGDDGFWYYTDEVAIEIWPNRFLEAPFDEGRLVWMGLEVKTKDRDWRRKHLAFALEPYSLNWYGNAPFRPAAKTKAQAMGQVLRERKKNGGDLLAALETTGYDPFETNRDWLTARLENPMRIHWDGLEPVGDQFAYGRSVNYSYGTKGSEKPQWLFGVCEDFEQAVEGVQREMTSDSKIYSMLSDGPSELLMPLLLASVKQALAGRAGGDKPNRVAFPAARIFQRHMEAAEARSDKIRRKLGRGAR